MAKALHELASVQQQMLRAAEEAEQEPLQPQREALEATDPQAPLPPKRLPMEEVLELVRSSGVGAAAAAAGGSFARLWREEGVEPGEEEGLGRARAECARAFRVCLRADVWQHESRLALAQLLFPALSSVSLVGASPPLTADAARAGDPVEAGAHIETLLRERGRSLQTLCWNMYQSSANESNDGCNGVSRRAFELHEQ